MNAFFRRPGVPSILAIAMVACFGSQNAHTQQTNKQARFISIISENDNYTPSRDDRHYTNGLRLAYGFAKNSKSPWRDWLGELTPLADSAEDREYEIAIGQNLYTPENFVTPLPINNDRPFAGWLYGELSVTTRSTNIEESLAISVGVVGPAALGEESQKFIHDISGDPEPGGWDNQLDNEPALLLRYRRSWFMPMHQSENMNVDLVPRVGMSLGNVVTEAGIGANLRIGSFLPNRDIPLRIQPGLSGSSTRFDSRAGRTDWMLYGGVQGRGVAHNVFLDGSTFEDSLSVDKKEFVWDASVGLMLTFGQFSNPLSLSFTHVWRGKEFEQQTEIDKFASAQIAIQF